MGLHLMAVTWNLQFLGVVLEVAFGLGMVIFIHELGHFAVAKWCGVKCEKFYLGFDIYGLKLAKFQYGETEYGIGILPLGGYVKMLGQDDNPSRAAQERERSTVHAGDGGMESNATISSAESAQLDPRSYMAKSVPQRMAIISAGVIMNVIFAFCVAVIAYLIGVRDIACGISAVLPGEAAWKANLEPGDQILQINDSGDWQLRFRDLMSAVALANLEKGVDFEIRREGVEKPFWVNVKPDPDKRRMRPTIGVVQPRTLALSDKKPAAEGTPAAAAGFEPGDKLVAVDGKELHGYRDLLTALVRNQTEPLRLTVERTKGDKKADHSAETTRVDVEVAPRPMKTLGLVMKMGKITAVQANSPAAAADLRAGDFLVSIDGEPPADPMRLPDAMRRRAGQTVSLVITREGPAGESEKLEKQITPRDPEWFEDSEVPGSPMSAPALGIAYKVLNVVHQTDKDSPAARAKLMEGDNEAGAAMFASGDEIVKARFILPKKASDSDQEKADALQPVEFGGEHANWPFLMNQVQWLPEGSSVQLTLKDGRTATLEPASASDWYYADRGMINGMEFVTARAKNFAEALEMGGHEAIDAVTQTYAFLRKIGTQISAYGLGGPKTIAEAAGAAAYEGISQFLIFLTLLSANLAVVNFLPIPLLDGGHMVFLILEGILRRPVSERVVVAFHYFGFVFIISLMLFVLGLDFGLIPRPH